MSKQFNNLTKKNKLITRKNMILGSIGVISAFLLKGCITISNKYSKLFNYNYKNGKFINPVETKLSVKASTFWRMMTTKNIRRPKKTFKFKADKLTKTIQLKDGLKTMWLGHSSVYIEIDGKRFIIDPIFSKYASPIQFVGPDRFFENPINIKSIPKLDGVIISHDHYDHLDCGTIIYLGKTGVMFYVPLIVGEYLTEWGIPKNQIKELNWWESIKVGENHKLTATPSRHFSGRGLLDRDKTLWVSWVIEGSKHKVFFGGDGGYWHGYKTIGEKFGPFDLTFIEIGAFDKEWAAIHMGPVNAVQANKDLKGKVLHPIHWGTFNLGIHSWDDPVKKVVAEAKKMNVQIALPKPGKLNNIEKFPQISNWWV